VECLFPAMMHYTAIASVASAPKTYRTGISRIIVGVDFSPVSERALSRAVDIAEQLGATIVACHVIPIPIPTLETAALGMVPTGLDLRQDPDRARKSIDDLMARFAHRPVEMSAVLRQGDAATEIAVAAREVHADLIVVGTQARTGVSRILLGDLAQAVVRSTNLPVMLLHDPLDEAL
jgi:nucleotide-binding universal stress UspA family protein